MSDINILRLSQPKLLQQKVKKDTFIDETRGPKTTTNFRYEQTRKMQQEDRKDSKARK